MYFVAKGVLTEGADAEGGEPIAGSENLYVFERDGVYPSGHIAFVATLSESENDQRDWQSDDERPVQATPDGRFLVFQSTADLTNGDTSTVPQVFEYDAVREELVRVSQGEVNYVAGSESANVSGGSIAAQSYLHSLPAKAVMSNLSVSDDGAVVVFQSAGGLTKVAKAAGEAERLSVFEYRSSGVLSAGEVFSVSSGNSSFNAGIRSTDRSGQDVIFQTQAPILVSDADTQEDLYDARDGGGILAPVEVKNCEVNAACQEATGVAPAFDGMKSMDVPGNDSGAVSGHVHPPPMPLRSSRARRLASALKACRKAHKAGKKRRSCEAAARRRFGRVPAKAKG